MFTALQQLKAKIRYFVDRAFAREFAGQLLLLCVLVVTVTLIGMTALFVGLFADENANIETIPRDIDQGFWDALWWSFNQVLYLQSFADMYGASSWVLLYAFFLSLMGLGTLGILVSVISTAIDNRIAALRRGETPVLERQHVLILGWNNKVFSVLQQLARLEPGIKAVILAPIEIDVMQQELRMAGIGREPITIILRNGIPSNRSELERVALEQASSVIILATGAEDNETIKLLVLLAAKQDWPGAVPTLTAEIAHENNYELATIAARDRTQIISSTKIISKVIVQTIRNPGLADIYHELFAVDQNRNSIYVQQIPQCINVAFEKLAHQLTDAIPVGVTWQKNKNGSLRHAVALNPGPDYEVLEDEQLILITHGVPVAYQEIDNAYPPLTDYHGSINHIHIPRNILIIGWTDMAEDTLIELNAHALQGTRVTLLVGEHAVPAYQAIVQKQAAVLPNLNLAFQVADATKAESYAQIILSTYQCIVVLADNNGHQHDADTHTLRILLRLSEQRQSDPVKAHTVVELIDESNRALIAGLGVDDVVISPDIISELLTQIARQAILGPIYHELLSAGGVEISLRPASEYVALHEDCHFDDLIAAAHQKLEVALGLRFVGRPAENNDNNSVNGVQDGRCAIEARGAIVLNPPRDQCWCLTERDQVIVLAQQLY